MLPGMIPDYHEVQDAAAYLQAALDRGDFHGINATALGRQYAPLKTAAAVIRIALIDWHDHQNESAAIRRTLNPGDPERAALRKEIISLCRRVIRILNGPRQRSSHPPIA
jgi:hypothetical protein